MAPVETMTAAELATADATHVMGTYGDRDLAFVRGEGAALFDPDGRPYLDFLCGLAVTNLGHAHPQITAAIQRQAATLLHTSNLYLTPPAIELAGRLAEVTGWNDARTFFAQCGATANEAALKLARRHGRRQHPDKIRVVTLEGSFHGRTFATLEATGQPAKHEPFAPLLGCVDTVPFDDAETLRAAVNDRTCAILIEPVQGEGGVRPVPDDVLLAARAAADEHGALLIADEVQTGMFRTGSWFAFQRTPVVPDVVTVAKALGNGLPIGACIARGEAATVLGPGDHATTFGGNPVTSAAALAVIDVLAGGLGARVDDLHARLVGLLEELVGRVPHARGVRGRGLLLGLELDAPVAKAVELACRDRFLLVNAVAPDVLRLAPPFVVTDEELQLGVAAIASALADVAEEETP